MRRCRKISSCLFALFLLSVNAYAQLKNLKDAGDIEIPSHPRLLLLQGEEQQIINTISSDPIWADVHKVIITECDKIITLPLPERKMEGRRLLSVSREELRRIFYLAYSYRISGQEKYLQRAEKEMLEISAFSDWNPSHFLDVAEMTMALAIGYDWLYHGLSQSSRTIIKNAILSKGLDPTFNSKDAWFLEASHNWNQVCNAGAVFGALAIYEDIPEISKIVIERAISTIRHPMEDYAPDGAYPEGFSYWGYGTGFNVLLLNAIEKIYKTDFGVTKLPGFLNTAGYLENMTGTTGYCFNYGDCGEGKGHLNPAMFWFASQLHDPSLLWVECNYLTSGRISARERLLPALMLWGKNINVLDIKAPQQRVWVGNGTNPVALMRTSWTDQHGIFVGFKGGTASSNHAHMDAGSFVMDADGVRWAMDFGPQDYTQLEERGVDLWNRSQNSQRWEVFRYNNFVHNTLTINNEFHKVEGYAKINSSSDNPNFLNAISDLSEIFEGQLSDCKRGIAIVDKKYVVVRDELKTLKKETTVRWSMLTSAEAKITGKNSIELKKDNKKLIIEILEPAKVIMKTWSTQPTHDYDAPNPGTILVGFEVKIPAETNAVLSVKLVPESAGKTMSMMPGLDEWIKNYN